MVSFLAQAINGNKIIVKGDGNRFRDFIFIDDIVDLTINSIDNKKSYGKTFNLANGKKDYCR